MSPDQEKLIAELVEKGLSGDMDPINAIEDRVLRSKAKSALATLSEIDIVIDPYSIYTNKKVKVLVTGGAGFIGSHLVEKLVERCYSVRVLDNLSRGTLEHIIHLINNGDTS